MLSLVLYLQNVRGDDGELLLLLHCCHLNPLCVCVLYASTLQWVLP